MRFVVKDEKDKTERLAHQDTYLMLLELARTRDKRLISEAIYRESYDTEDGKRSKVEDQLKISYKNKCAYCERLCKADIEHYRPKGKVDEDEGHPGYFWLCYEWTNLLPSCITCNREGGKHNQFPIMGNRVFSPDLLPNDHLALDTFKAYSATLLAERPMLLHPEIDHPENYFAFSVDPEGIGIRLVGIDPEGRGTSTIEICRLNRREVTLDRVERVIDGFKDSVECLFVELLREEVDEGTFVGNMIRQIRALRMFGTSENKTHTLLRQYIMRSRENFASIVLPFLTPKIRRIVLAAYDAATVYS
jgi:uncharacterized protein (TIGR02646 family)